MKSELCFFNVDFSKQKQIKKIEKRRNKVKKKKKNGNDFASLGRSIVNSDILFLNEAISRETTE